MIWSEGKITLEAVSNTHRLAGPEGPWGLVDLPLPTYMSNDLEQTQNQDDRLDNVAADSAEEEGIRC